MPFPWEALSLPYVVTLETAAAHADSDAFLATMRDRGWRYEVVGRGERWSNMQSKIPLMRQGLRDLLHALRAADGAPHDDDLVVLSDARDVLCTRGPFDFREAYYSHAKCAPILASMERWAASDGGSRLEIRPDAPPAHANNYQCSDPAPYWKAVGGRPAACVRPFFNAGLLAGRLGALLAFYEWLCTARDVDGTPFVDDQRGLGAYANAFPSEVCADWEARMLHTSGGALYQGAVPSPAAAAGDSPSLNQLFGRTAFFLHVPGREKHAGQDAVYRAAALVLRSTTPAAMGATVEWGVQMWVKG